MLERGPRPIVWTLLMTMGLAVTGCGVFSDRTGDSGARASESPVRIQVLVAKSDLPRSTILQEKHLRWQPWPDGSYPPEGHLLEGQIKLANLYGSALRRNVAAGKPVLYELIVRPRDPAFLATAPRPGYQAYGLPITGRVTSMETALAGDQVAVLLSHVSAQDERFVKNVKVFLRNVRLLALVRDRPRSVVNAILEVAPKQAEKLDAAKLAQDRGEFSLYRGGMGEDDSELDCPVQPRPSC